VIGVGNEIAGDDAAGPAVIEALRGRVPDDVELINAGCDALGVLPHLEEEVHTIIVDAARMGRAPGEVAVFGAEKARVRILADAWSLHGIGLAYVLQLAERMRLPARITIVGIEPAGVEPGQAMSPVVAAAIPRAVESVESILRIQYEAGAAPCTKRRN